MAKRNRRDVKLLIKIITTIYKHYGDSGTWKHREGNHHVMSFRCGKGVFKVTIAKSPNTGGLATDWANVRRELRRVRLDKGNNKYWNQLTVRMAKPFDTYDSMRGYQSALEDLLRTSKTYPYSRATKSYFRDINNLQKRNIPHRLKKPYRKKIEYGDISYWGYYAWGVKFRRNDQRVEGFMSVDKLTYQQKNKHSYLLN